MLNTEAIGIRRSVPDRWSAREVMAGEWSTSPLLWLIALPFIVLVQHARLKGYFGSDTPSLLVISALGQIAALLVLMILRKVAFRKVTSQKVEARWPSTAGSSLAAVLATWFLAGVAAGVVTALVLDRVLPGQRPQIWGAVLLMGTTSVLAYSLIAFTLGVLRGHRTEVDRLRAYRDVLVLRSQESGAFADDQQRLLRAALEDAVIPAFRDLGDRVDALSYRPHQEELEQLRLRVLITSESIVKRVDDGIERAVQEQRASRMSRITGGRQSNGGMRSILLGFSVPPRPGCLIVACFAVTEIPRGCPALSGIMAVAMGVAILAGAFVRRRVSAESTSARLAVTLATVTSLLVVFWGVTRLEIAGCAWSGSTDLTITSSITLMATLIFTGVSLEAARQLRGMSAELGADNEAAQAAIAALDDSGRTLREQVSNVLNGVLQGRLGAIALALQVHLDDLDRGGHPGNEVLVAKVTALLRLADEDLARMLDEPMRPVPLDVVLVNLRSRWAGLLAIDWHVDSGAHALLDDDTTLLRWSAEVIDQAVRSASRHGNSTALTVDVSTADHVGRSGRIDRRLMIRVQDNGSGPSAQGMRGGSTARAIAQRNGIWALRSGAAGGAELTIELPASRGASDTGIGLA